MPVDLKAIRARAVAATDLRHDGQYSTFEVSDGETVTVGDKGGSLYGTIDVPFGAIAVGGPTVTAYNDHVLALVPTLHEDAQSNADLFAHAKGDILALLDEVERLRGR